VGVIPEILYDSIFELPRQAVERRVGALVREPRAAPVEELDQRPPEALVLLTRAVAVPVEARKQASKTNLGDRSMLDVPMRGQSGH
jgi:hypothetical protein